MIKLNYHFILILLCSITIFSCGGCKEGNPTTETSDTTDLSDTSDPNLEVTDDSNPTPVVEDEQESDPLPSLEVYFVESNIRPPNKGVDSLTYTAKIVIVDNENQQTYGSEYDRAYDVFTKESLLEIQANSAAENGRVKHPSHFNDSDWHCWNTKQVNIDC
jgi:hypothetical protein